jgi:predicted nucleotidyltransferase
MNVDVLIKVISSWASNLPHRVRIYFYGSQIKGTSNHESDYDLAIEFLDSWIDRTLTWMDYHYSWESQLSKITHVKVHLTLYVDENVNVRKYVNEGSVIIFESPETDDEYFENDPALLKLLKKE